MGRVTPGTLGKHSIYFFESGDIARSSDSDTVEIEHVEQAKDRLETDQLLEGVKNYSTHGKLTLWR